MQLPCTDGPSSRIGATSAQRRTIVFIHAGHPIETVAAELSRRDFEQFGLRLIEFSVMAPDGRHRLYELLQKIGPDIFFFYSMNFWALNITSGDDLLHAATGIPLAIMMHDHPVYFLSQISRSLDRAIVVTPGDELPDFIDKYYAADVQTIADRGFRPHLAASAPVPDESDFNARENALLCPMNLCIYGLTSNDIWRRITDLPKQRSDRVRALIELTIPDCFTPIHLLLERLEDRDGDGFVIDDLRWAMDFVKLQRRLLVVRALLDLPALFSTEYVPPEFKRQEKKFTLLTRPQTVPLYGKYRFVINVNPLIDCLHDRVTESLRNNSVCITDPNRILAGLFEDEKEMLFIDYARHDLAARVARLLDDPHGAYAMTLAAYRRQHEPGFSDNAHGRLIAAVQERWSN